MAQGSIDPRDRLIIGLDVATRAEAEAIVTTLDADGTFYKIGYQLAFAGGLELARELVAGGKKVFLDMKLLDIDNTVASAVENIVKMWARMWARSRPTARRRPPARRETPRSPPATRWSRA